jgi:SAM-dependent methyltransferase
MRSALRRATRAGGVGKEVHEGDAARVGFTALTDRAPAHLSFLPILDFLRCPVDGAPLAYDRAAGRLTAEGNCHSYPIQAGIPCLFAPNDWPVGRTDVTDTVKSFYEKTPFPNYDGLDSRESLRRKARDDVFTRMLDEQIPHSVTILEVGCGTGQMTNFLGMGWGRTAIGADICMNSLQLAKGFRDRFSINNAHFAQMNLFMPPFEEGKFDIVLSNGVLHHTSDCAGAFRSIARLVKPGGFVIVGLYNRFGRLPTLCTRWLMGKFGKAGMLLDHRLRGMDDSVRRQAWFMDQYKHPHETRHSISEVLTWFGAAGYDFMSCVPTIGDTEFSEKVQLFEPHSPGHSLDRLSTELEMLLTGGADNGLFIMVGRKRT